MGVFKFSLERKVGGARFGKMITPHGEINTPVFMPVGTQATIKSVLPSSVWDMGIRILLSNAYHLYLRPGVEVVRQGGGLHKFMNWPGAILTDSGGFQVLSLGHMVSVTDEAALFRSHIDGSLIRFRPEDSINAQIALGADIIMCFDQCTSYPIEEEEAREAMERTILWSKRAKNIDIPQEQALFGIVQGSTYPELRKECALRLGELDFHGYALGGLSVGESKNRFYDIIERTQEYLPENKPRYLMGVGHPMDLIHGVTSGIDMFDCVLPTRNARHGRAFTFQGPLNMKNARFTQDYSPVEPDCDCPCCTGYSRSYIRHLLSAGETLGWTLLTIHNIGFFHRFMENLKDAILCGKLDSFKSDISRVYGER